MDETSAVNNILILKNIKISFLHDLEEIILYFDEEQLEKVFYQTLKEITGSIFVSKYIPNDNELNIFAAWNRNGIIRNFLTKEIKKLLGVGGSFKNNQIIIQGDYRDNIMVFYFTYNFNSNEILR